MKGPDHGVREKRAPKFTDPQLVGFYFSDLAFPWLFPRIRGNATVGYKVDDKSLANILKETKKKKEEREEILKNIEILSKFLEEGKTLVLDSFLLDKLLETATPEEKAKILEFLNLTKDGLKNGDRELSGEELIWLLNNLNEEARKELFEEVQFANISQKPSPDFVPLKNVTSLAEDAIQKIELFTINEKVEDYQAVTDILNSFESNEDRKEFLEKIKAIQGKDLSIEEKEKLLNDILRDEANLSDDFKEYIEELVLNNPDELVKLFSTDNIKDDIKSVLSSKDAPKAILNLLEVETEADKKRLLENIEKLKDDSVSNEEKAKILEEILKLPFSLEDEDPAFFKDLLSKVLSSAENIADVVETTELKTKTQDVEGLKEKLNDEILPAILESLGTKDKLEDLADQLSALNDPSLSRRKKISILKKFFEKQNDLSEKEKQFIQNLIETNPDEAINFLNSVLDDGVFFQDSEKFFQNRTLLEKLLPKEIKRKLKETINTLKDPSLKTDEKVKIVKNIIGTVDGLSEAEKKYLDGLIYAIINNPDDFLDTLNEEEELEEKINQIFNNPRNKNKIREYVKVLRNPNLTQEEKEAILKDLLELPDDASEDERKYAQGILDALINEEWDESEIYDKVSEILSNSTQLTTKQKDVLKDKIYTLKNLDISDEDRAFILDEIFRLNGDNVNDDQIDAILEILDLDNFTEDENKSVKKYSKIATILEISPEATDEEKKSLYKKLKAFEKPDLDPVEQVILVDEILRLKDNVDDEETRAILNALEIGDLDDKNVAESYSKIAAILGLPSNASREEKEELVSKLKRLQDPNIGSIEKALLVDEILQLKGKIESNQKSDILTTLLKSDSLTNKEKELVENFSNIGDTLLGDSPTENDKKELLTKLEILQDKFTDSGDKALILDEILRLEDEISDEKLQKILDNIKLETVMEKEKDIANKYFKIANILGISTDASPREKEELVSKIEMLEDPNISDSDKILLIDEILRIKGDIDEEQEEAILKILDAGITKNKKNNILKNYSKIASILDLPSDASPEDRKKLASKLKELQNPNLNANEKALIVEEILRLKGNIDGEDEESILNLLGLDEDEKNAVKNFAAVAKLLGFPSNATEEDKKKLLTKLEMLNDPDIDATEKALILDEIIRLNGVIGSTNTDQILDILKQNEKEKQIAKEFSKVASLLGISPEASKEQKKKLISKIELLNDPNLSTYEKALIIDEILRLKENINNSKRKEILEALETAQPIKDFGRDYSEIASILGISPTASAEEKRKLLSKIESLQDPNLGTAEKAIIIDEILRLKGDLGSSQKKALLNVLTSTDSTDEEELKVIKDYSSIASILGLPPDASKEDKQKLLAKIEMLQDPNISASEKALIIDEIFKLKGTINESKKQEILDILGPNISDDSEKEIVKEYSKISSILGLPPNASKEEKLRLISKLKLLQDPNLSTAEKAIIINEILKLNDNLSETKRKEILNILEPENGDNKSKKVIEDYSKISSILGLPPNSSKEEKKELIEKLEMLQDPNLTTAEKAIIINEIIQLAENLSDAAKQKILTALQSENSEENKVIKNYSKIASILGLPLNTSKEEKERLISKLELLQDPNITAEEKALIIDEILRFKENLSESKIKEILDVLKPSNTTDLSSSVIEDYSKIASILGIPVGASKADKKELISKLKLLQDPNISPLEKAIIIDEILKLKGNLSESQKTEIISLLETGVEGEQNKKVIEEYSKIASILGLTPESSNEDKRRLFSKLELLNDPNLSIEEKALLIDEILNLTKDLSDSKKSEIITLLEPDNSDNSKTKVIADYSKIASILGFPPGSSQEQKRQLISNLEKLQDPNLSAADKAIIIDEILKLKGNLSESQKKKIINILEPEEEGKDKIKVIKDYSQIASILGLNPNSPDDQKRKLIAKLEMLNDPNISTEEKAIIIDQILNLTKNLSDSKKNEILDILEPDSTNSKKKVITDYSKIASILGLPPGSSNEEKRNLISKLEKLQDPNISAEEKAIIIDEILKLKTNLSESQEKEILSLLKGDDKVNVLKDFSKIASILGLPPGSSNEEKLKLISKLKSLQDPNISDIDKAIIIDEILKLKGNLSEADQKEILKILKPMEEGNAEKNNIIEDYSKISEILGLPSNSSREEKKKLLSKLEMLQDPNISIAEKAIILDEILRLKGNLSESQKKEVLNILDSQNSGKANKKILQDYTDIASILGLPNTSSDERKELISKLDALRDPNISAAEKAIIVDEILRLTGDLPSDKKNEILKILKPIYAEGPKGEIVKEFSKIASLIGLPLGASEEEKKKLFLQLEALKDPNLDDNEKALILDEILRSNGNLSDEAKAEIYKSLGLTEDSIITEYSKIASILGIAPNASAEEKKQLLLKLEELKDPNIGAKEKAKIIDDILRIKGTISQDIRDKLLKELTDFLEDDERERILKEVKIIENQYENENQYETVDSLESVLDGLDNFSVEDKRNLLDSIFKLQDILKKSKLDLNLSFADKIRLEKEKEKLIKEINEFLKDTKDANGNPLTVQNILPYPLDDSSELDPNLLLNKDILYKVISEEEDDIKNEIKVLEETLNEKPLRASERREILQKIEELKEILESLSRRYDDLEQRYRQRFKEQQTKLSPERIRLFMKLYKINDAIAFLKKNNKRPQSINLTKKRKATKRPIRFTQSQLNRFYLNRRCKNILCRK